MPTTIKQVVEKQPFVAFVHRYDLPVYTGVVKRTLLWSYDPRNVPLVACVAYPGMGKSAVLMALIRRFEQEYGGEVEVVYEPTYRFDPEVVARTALSSHRVVVLDGEPAILPERVKDVLMFCDTLMERAVQREKVSVVAAFAPAGLAEVVRDFPRVGWQVIYLPPPSVEDVVEVLKLRLAMIKPAGHKDETSPFGYAALRRIAILADCVPRAALIIAHYASLYAYKQNYREITEGVVEEAVGTYGMEIIRMFASQTLRGARPDVVDGYMTLLTIVAREALPRRRILEEARGQLSWRRSLQLLDLFVDLGLLEVEVGAKGAMQQRPPLWMQNILELVEG